MGTKVRGKRYIGGLKPTTKSLEKVLFLNLKSMKIELSTTLGKKSNLSVALSSKSSSSDLGIGLENELSTIPYEGG